MEKSNFFHVCQISFVVLISAIYAASFTCDTNNTILIQGTGASVAVMATAASGYAANRSITTARNVAYAFDTTNAALSLLKLQGLISTNVMPIFADAETFFKDDVNPNPNQFVQFPLLAEAMVVVFNLPEVPSLNLSLATVADIYSGQIMYWNDSDIKMQNPRVADLLPNTPIVQIARMDDSGLTRLFTGALSAASTEWQKYGYFSMYGEFSSPEFVGGSCCNSTNWEAATIDIFANQTIGMTGLVSSLPYTIGYTLMNDAISSGMQMAALLNRQSNLYINASFAGIREAMNYWTGQITNQSMVSFRLLEPRSPTAYPLATFLEILVNRWSLGNFSCCALEEFVGYLDFFYATVTDDIAASASNCVTLNNVLEDRIRTTILPTFVCNGRSVYSEYLDSLATNNGLTTQQIVLVAVLSAIVVLALISGIIVFLWRKTMSDEKIWMIPSRALDLTSILLRHSLSSLSSRNSSKSLSSSRASKAEIVSISQTVDRLKFPQPQTVYDERKVMLLELSTKPPVTYHQDTKKLMFRFCQKFSHQSLSHLYGICNVGTKVYALQEFCHKGTLHHVLMSSRFEMSERILVTMATDLAEGMAYLHMKGVVHGLLNSLACYVSSSWILKISNWMTTSILERENKTYMEDLIAISFNKAELQNEKLLIELLYLYPGIRRLKKVTPVCDTFSYGMLLAEILNRQTPYSKEALEGQPFHKIIKNKFHLEVGLLPKLAPAHPSPVLESLMKGCLNESMTSFETILRELYEQRSGHVGGITDVLMETMESLLDNTEKKNKDLNKVTSKISDILNQVLPPSIAEKFLLGQTVDPEYFENVTVYFSEIIDFTGISARSTPMDVMAFLNDLWIAFDNVIEKFDCYKVDTIGDNYMVCSGLPKRNGILHVRQIADLSFALLDTTAGFSIRHLPNEQMKIRIGINSGPVTAGVVGNRMPQYCVFGDTVNTASRMESTSMAGKIQCSDVSAELLTTYFPYYQLERRGDIEVKGKGMMTTFWLEPATGLRALGSNDASIN